MTLEDLDRISIDDNAVIDALTYLLWRAPSIAPLVDAAGGFGPKFPSCPAKHLTGSYCVTFRDFGPYAVQPFTDHPRAMSTDLYAVFFTYDYISKLGGAFAGAFNSVDQMLAHLILSQGPDTAYQSEVTMDTLLNYTQGQAAPGAPTFHDYHNNAGYWGPELARLAMSEGFIRNKKLLSVVDPLLTKRSLMITLYKLLLLEDNGRDVARRWNMPDLSGTVFPLAANADFPENYLRNMLKGENPMKPIVDGAVRRNSDAVWRFIAGAATYSPSVLGHPNYPRGFDPHYPPEFCSVSPLCHK